ncbi:MAG: radical SAM family heme chaperone HemW [Chromatiales bacterium]|jgi:oxygen-independent coproporphyrinogen-3 oxidase|nr:radical SAM family heme chaperone HemW [Chromatiales bacterium]MDX9767709.1 radical SAM family heme chaperone HemW [Ectothiorhodospiraceae bacterium]
MTTLQLPPLSLYVHVPWCLRKCPYCDFNSHALAGALPEVRYVDALLADLEAELPQVWGRRLDSLFIGGGTPSLLSAAAVDRLLSGIRARLPLRPDAEVTLEANPGAVEQGRFEGYREAGVNRLSIGVQSFDDTLLARIGRVHSADEARRAAQAARAAGFDNFNLDLMYGLPGQTPAQSLADLERAVALAPPHLSRYQLTLEPNTLFHARPPALPEDDDLWRMHEEGADALAAHGYTQYEVSAWARPGGCCRHNLNYWQFGDYLGIGAGAHGKLSLPAEGRILRYAKPRDPERYAAAALAGAARTQQREVGPAERAFELMLNGLRLVEGIDLALCEAHAGVTAAMLEPGLGEAQARDLLRLEDGRLVPTALGRRFLNDLLALFLPDEGGG